MFTHLKELRETIEQIVAMDGNLEKAQYIKMKEEADREYIRELKARIREMKTKRSSASVIPEMCYGEIDAGVVFAYNFFCRDLNNAAFTTDFILANDCGSKWLDKTKHLITEKDSISEECR